ncbi:DNA-directed RNA polymerase subunit omega [Anaerotignum lactatifermentans]|uniref:DNA-directed RNA polymerase subunit omega n=1 Tax=Anaerotignum lactatifermentans TaxID=160404 RepID=A0ABS2G6S7_9FIRM|nr:DNA-directed RNA polymerase subunit omega [Anaerotignum lactatifermentans]MBM6829728.1 DNA-directed RNA polymerase subunit omega [Anaerotignum lactatifermentans]MBM6877149.1 DNA-directed RNA polymerase subunit omega [Anaerotignum lactatifermentans]MBM6951387.1 DNA-directed RNA polymerase subunit omega [Anaerotignum lactatifermentans]
MLRPSYTDLLDVITKDSDDITLGSRYTIVIAAAKRARQLVDHAEPMVSDTKVDKPVSIAINELYQGKIKVHQGRPAAEEEAEETEELMDAVSAEEETAEEETTEEI